MKGNFMAVDKDGRDVFLAQTPWILKVEQENNPDIKFHFNSEFKLMD